MLEKPKHTLMSAGANNYFTQLDFFHEETQNLINCWIAKKIRGEISVLEFQIYFNDVQLTVDTWDPAATAVVPRRFLHFHKLVGVKKNVLSITPDRVSISFITSVVQLNHALYSGKLCSFSSVHTNLELVFETDPI